jgi:hypothetical protein
MYFLMLDKLLPIESQKDLYMFWLRALAYRRGHEHLEKELANYVFLISNKARKMIQFNTVMDDITYEFAALETPPTGKREKNALWLLVESNVNKEFLRTHS